MDQTHNLSLPYIMPGQAQKHVTHNEALGRLDALTQLAVESRILTAPPDSPPEAAAYIVPDSALGGVERPGGSHRFLARRCLAFHYAANRMAGVVH